MIAYPFFPLIVVVGSRPQKYKRPINTCTRTTCNESIMSCTSTLIQFYIVEYSNS